MASESQWNQYGQQTKLARIIPHLPHHTYRINVTQNALRLRAHASHSTFTLTSFHFFVHSSRTTVSRFFFHLSTLLLRFGSHKTHTRHLHTDTRPQDPQHFQTRQQIKLIKTQASQIKHTSFFFLQAYTARTLALQLP